MPIFKRLILQKVWNDSKAGEGDVFHPEFQNENFFNLKPLWAAKP